MKIKPKTLMVASLAVVLTAMSASTWAQPVGERSDRQQRPERPQRQQSTPIGIGEEGVNRLSASGAKIGQPAPNFTLKDSSGKSYSLSDYKGKLVILQWINPDCPICKRVNRSGITTAMTKAIRAVAKDFVHLTIHSTHYMELNKSVAYLKQHKVKAPVLDDRAGKVGHLYGAKTTPHMYVIDKKGILRYAGAIDDDDNGKNREGATNYVINAVRQIAAGETVAPDLTKAYGCPVKYDPGESQGTARAENYNSSRSNTTRIAQLDKDGDGKLDRDELDKLPLRARERMLKFDKNGDGALDKSELKAMEDARQQRLLERYDKDGDGKLSDEEREAMAQDRRGGRGGRGGDGGRRGGRGGDGGAS